jgi:tetratricopeptide (TPR) repeat protein
MGTGLFSHLTSLATGLLLMAAGTPVPAAETVPLPTPETAAKSPPEETDAQRAARAYLQLQEQLHAALLAIDQARQEADASARRNVETLTSRLKLIEESIATQREAEMASIQGLNRLVLVAVGVFAGIGLLGLFCTGWLQLRAMNRLAELATANPARPMLGYTRPAGALPSGEEAGETASPAANTNARLLEVIERLDKRVHELESAAHLPSNGESKVQSNGGDPRALIENVGSSSPAQAAATEDQASLMLGKGQALMHLGQADKAMACFDAALAIDPRNAEALVKKGSALERQERLEDAIACYDRAIEADNAMTLAYLLKGGVCNRLQRYDEALRCYEKALRLQEQA